MLPHERKLLTDQELRDASLDQIEDLVQRINLALQGRGMPGVVWSMPPEDRVREEGVRRLGTDVDPLGSQPRGEPTIERDYLAKEEALRRLSEPEGDHELHGSLERMRESHPHLWEVLHRVHLSGDADPSKLEKWRRAPEDSQEQIWAAHYDRAMGVLAMSFQ